MNSFRQIKFINNVQIIITIPVMLFFVLISIIWDVYFIRKIKQFVQLFRDSMKKAKTDPFGNSLEKAHHHQVEIVKYAFMLLINVAEFAAMQIYALGCTMAISFQSYHMDNSSNQNAVHECTAELTHFYSVDMLLILENPIISIIISIGQVAFLFSISFQICLLRFLDSSYHNKGNLTQLKYFLTITALTGILMIVSGSVPQLLILQKLVEPPILLIYFVVWFLHTRKFYKTLKWRSVEYRVRGMNNRLIRRSVGNSNQFALVMVSVGIVLVCFILSEFIVGYFFLIGNAVHYGPCLFQKLYGTSEYEPLLSTKEQMKVFHLFSNIEFYIAAFLYTSACIITGSQYIVATIRVLGSGISKDLKFRFGNVRTRFTPPLSKRLLP